MMMFPKCKGTVTVYETNEILKPKPYSFFAFFIKSNVVSENNYPRETTKIVPLYDNETYIDCEDNFTEEQRQSIIAFNVTSVKDFLEHEQFNKISKKVCLECYRYVKDVFECDGEEPDNGYDIVKIDGQFYLIRILLTGKIKYCRPLGSKHLIEDLDICYQSVYVKQNLLKNIK